MCTGSQEKNKLFLGCSAKYYVCAGSQERLNTNYTSYRMKKVKGEAAPFISVRHLFTSRVMSLLLTCLIFMLSTGCTEDASKHNAMTEPSLPTIPGDASVTLPEPHFPNDSDLTLRIAVHMEKNMNPLTPKHTDTRAVFSLVYEPLMRINADGRTELVLAESADFNTSFDMLRVKIRDQAVFHDNSSVRAEDVRACLLEIIRQVTGKTPGALTSPAALFAGEVNLPTESDHEPHEASSPNEEQNDQETRETDGAGQDANDDGTKQNDAENEIGDHSNTENVTVESDGTSAETDPISGTQIALHDIVAEATFMDALKSQRTLILSQNGGFDPAEYSTLYQYRTRALSNISSVSVEEGILYLSFYVPDRDAAQYLTFPVIPESFANNTTSLAVPGSGEWMIKPGGFRGHFSLHRVSVGEGISKIDVIPYDDISDAARAFDEGSVDLLFMDETTAPLYVDRSRIRKQRFEAPGYTSLYFSGQKESAIEARDRFRLALSEHSATKNELAAPHENAAFPVLRGDWRLFGSIEIYAGHDSTTSWTTLKKDEKTLPFVLLVPEGYYPARLINRLEPLFLLQNLELEVEVVPKEDWFEKLQEDDYDGAILTDLALDALDPVDWLDSLDEAGLWSWREHTNSSSIAILESLSSCPIISEKMSPEMRDARYITALKDVFETVPVFGIGGLDTMVWYGSDVRGTMSGTWNTPFEEIERLTLWRP